MAPSDFARALGVLDNRECRGYVAIPPSFGPPEKARVRWPLLILSLRLALGTPENAGVT